ncbi:MAG: ferrochelatase [Bacteroidota bacterium]
MKAKTAVVLLNLGTPDSPSTSDVRTYLSQFLNDPRVIDIPWLSRKLLVNMIIVPFRAPKSAKIYQELWTKDGSPLLLHSLDVKRKLQESLGEEFYVDLAMRYQNPSMESVLESVRKKNFRKIILVPMFPQYASSSTGSALEEAMRIISKWWVIPELSIISQYSDDPGYLDAFAEQGRKYDPGQYDHVIFSYHGLPIRQVDKVYNDGACADRDCEHEHNDENNFCYKASCYATTRGIAERLNIPEEKYTVSFQSRLNDKWLKPFSDKVVEELAQKGCKNILVFSPAFTADCLETTIEIGHEYLEIFKQNGGEHLQLVESLNSNPMWIDTLKKLVLKRS